MEWVEIAARTVEDAKDAALNHLGVAEEDAEFEVLEEPRSGILGIRRTEARVRARVRPVRPRSKAERRVRRGRDRGARRQRSHRAEQAKAGSGAATDQGGQRVAVAPAARKSRPRGQSSHEQSGGRPMDSAIPLEEQGEIAARFLEGLLESFELTGDIEEQVVDEETIELGVTGEGLGLLIGPKGSTLSALQEVTRTVVQRRSGGRTARLLVDVGGYRQKRHDALERFTRGVVERVLESGEEEHLEPMSPSDRKVVHDLVNEVDGVATRSEGDEPRRYVVITRQ